MASNEDNASAPPPSYPYGAPFSYNIPPAGGNGGESEKKEDNTGFVSVFIWSMILYYFCAIFDYFMYNFRIFLHLIIFCPQMIISKYAFTNYFIFMMLMVFTFKKPSDKPVPQPRTNVPIFPEIPDLPSVPSDMPGNDIDFDDLTKRFEQLKKKK